MMAVTKTKKSTYYRETQRFDHPLLWIFLVPLLIFTSYLVYRQVLMGEEMGTQPVSNLMLIIFALIPLGTICLFAIIRLEMRLTEEGVRFRFFPLHREERLIRWEEIRKAEVKQYSPLKDFGGWGIRWKMTGNGRAYNIRGKWGLHIDCKNDRSLLIGTQEPGKLKKVLQRLEGRE